MPHKDDSLFSILTVTMIIIIYLGNKTYSEKISIWRLWVLFHLYCVGQAIIVTKSLHYNGICKARIPHEA